MRTTCFLLLLACGLTVAQEPQRAEIAKPAPAPAKMILPATPLVGRAGVSADRAGDVKRHITGYEASCVRFVETVQRAKTDEEKATALKTPPNLRLVSMLLGQIVAANPKDDAAFDALAFLCRYSGVPSVDAALSNLPGAKPSDPTRKIEPFALLLEHHANNAKITEVTGRLDAIGPHEKFLNELFAKTANAEVRGLVGYKLASVKPTTAEEEAAHEKLLEQLANDRYMASVKLGTSTRTVRDWADGQLREVRVLAIGKTLPDVGGEDLNGKKKSIRDYRGKVVVVDVWATWCGPCKAMIPHEREMTKRLEGKPFALLSVSCDEEKAALTDFLKKTEMPWDHWWVGRGGEFSKAMNIQFYPTIYVLDAKGVIRFKNIRGEKLEAAVEELLKETK